MKEDQDTIIVFTARSPDRIVREGGSQAWILNPVHARQCRWLLCTQNRHNPDHEFSDATEPHGAAFLLGKVSSIERVQDRSAGDRWIVVMSEFARLCRPGLWDHGRNPVRYANLKSLDIDPDRLEFQQMPPRETDKTPPLPAAISSQALTIAEAKKVLAATFGVTPEAVEITIRG